MNCGFPTPTGRCRRPVTHVDQRCFQHAGRSIAESASEAAAEMRQRPEDQCAARVARADPAAASRTPTALTDQQIAETIGCLNRHGVVYVVIGGAAVQSHGAPVRRTTDIDIVPQPDAANIDRLVAALEELGACLMSGASQADGVRVPLRPLFDGPPDRFINLVTSHGPVDVTFRPDGTDGYDVSRGTDPWSTCSARRFRSRPWRPSSGRSARPAEQGTWTCCQH